MTDPELLIECKKGLGIPQAATTHDGVLNQKIFAVKSFMTGAGVSDVMMNDSLAIGVIVMGVSDLWKVDGGEAKFSSAFTMLVTQLALRSQVVV